MSWKNEPPTNPGKPRRPFPVDSDPPARASDQPDPFEVGLLAAEFGRMRRDLADYRGETQVLSREVTALHRDVKALRPLLKLAKRAPYLGALLVGLLQAALAWWTSQHNAPSVALPAQPSTPSAVTQAPK